MDRDRIVKIAREEIGKHSMDTFVENPPSIAQGGQNTFKIGLLHKAKQVDNDSLVAQRLKRLSSIATKLRRYPNMKLS